jgi:hypothetical protein
MTLKKKKKTFFDKFQVETHLLWMIVDHVISA